MKRTKYQGAIQVYVSAHGRYYIFKWDGRQYLPDFVTESATSLSIPEVDFRISNRDLDQFSRED